MRSTDPKKISISEGVNYMDELITINLSLIEPEEAQETLKTVMNCFQHNLLNKDERMSILLTCIQAAMRERLCNRQKRRDM